MLLPRIKLFLPVLWSIVHLQPTILAAPPPSTACYLEKYHTYHLFEQDCGSLAGLAISNPRSPSDLSAWTEKPIHGSERSDWSISYGICHFSFRAKGPLSSETWDKVVEDLEAVQQDCVYRTGIGGYRIRHVDRGDNEPLGAPYLLFSVYIKQLDERPSRSLGRQTFQYSGRKRHRDTDGRTLRRRMLSKGHDAPPMATRRKLVGSTARDF
jgi:hypothetical protein